MLLDRKGNRATPGKYGECPLCFEPLVPKCGNKRIWHWAHYAGTGCRDPYGESESEWHLIWKDRTTRRTRDGSVVGRPEVVVERNKVRSFADIKLPNGIVVKLRRTPIGIDRIRECEDFYGRMVWLFDVDGADIDVCDKGNYCTFRWRHARQSIAACRKRVFLDLGGSVLEVKKHTAMRFGWGYLHSPDSLLAWLGGKFQTRRGGDSWKALHHGLSARPSRLSASYSSCATAAAPGGPRL
jgi:competence protein CoiA